MAFSQITSAEVAKNKPHTDTLGIKFKNNFDAHEDRLNAASGSKNSIPWDALEFPTVRQFARTAVGLTLGAEDILRVDSSGGVVTITFPAITKDGVVYTVKRLGGNNVVMETTGTDTVEDAATVTLSVDKVAATYVSDNTAKDWMRFSTAEA